MADETKDQPKEEPQVQQDDSQAQPQEPPKEEPSKEVTAEAPEETKEETPEVSEETQETPAEAQAEAPKPKRSRRAQNREDNLRLRNLINQMKSQPQTMTPQERQDAMNYSQELDADPDTIQRLEADRQAAQRAGMDQAMEQVRSSEFRTRLEIDAPRIESKYKFLDPSDKQNFNPGMADAINQWYLSSAGYDPATNSVQNPNLRYADFVEGVMEIANGVAKKKTAQSAENIAKQVANTGLRPGGEMAKGLDLSKHPKDMTDEEIQEAARQEAQALRK